MNRISTRIVLILGLALAVGLAVFVSPYASSSPDGLEKVAESKSFIDDGRLHALQESSPVPDYAFPGVSDPRLATALAGFTGTLLVAIAGVGIMTAPAAEIADARVSGLCNHALHGTGLAGNTASPVHRLDPRAKVVGFLRRHARSGHDAA